MLFLGGRSNKNLETIKNENDQVVAGSRYTVFIDGPVVSSNTNAPCERTQFSEFASSFNPDCHKPAIDEMCDLFFRSVGESEVGLFFDLNSLNLFSLQISETTNFSVGTCLNEIIKTLFLYNEHSGATNHQ